MSGLNALIHQPVRLQIMAALVALPLEAEMEFTALRDLLSVTDGNLGAHLRRLEKAGYVAIDKTFVNRKPRSYIKVTAAGRTAFSAHVAALQALLSPTSAGEGHP